MLDSIAMIATESELQRLAELPTRPGGAQVAALAVGGAGVDASETLTQGSGLEHRGGAVTLRNATLAYSADRGLIVRVANEFEIGAGASDHGAMFQGAFLFSLMGGYRLPVTKNQGPFARGGVLAFVAGNDLTYRSALMLPDAHVGYQWLLSRKALAEAAYTTGFVLTGRSDAAGDSRNLDLGVALGALAALHVDPVSLTARWLHVVAPSSASPVDWLEGSLCAEPGRFLSLCVRARWDRTDAAHVAQIGFTLGAQEKRRLHNAGLY